MNEDRMLRTVRLDGGEGRTYTLKMWDTGRCDRRGQARIGYTLSQDGEVAPIFDGDDFCPSPMHADDSDATVAALLGFLCLRPGDTDQEYFEDYTPRQWQWVAEDAESIGADVAMAEDGEMAPWTNLDGWEEGE